jgi:hypothetical protein
MLILFDRKERKKIAMKGNFMRGFNTDQGDQITFKPFVSLI